jgi:hypothetical protein
MEHVMATQRIFIQHAENNEEYEVTLYKPSGEPYRKRWTDMIVQTTRSMNSWAASFILVSTAINRTLFIPLKSDLYNKDKKGLSW